MPVTVTSPTASPPTASPAAVRPGTWDELTVKSDEDEDLTRVRPSGTPTAGKRPSREVSAFPRNPGVLGDLRYVFTVLFGGARARRQVRALDESIAASRTMRNQALTKLGQDAVDEDELDQTTITRARERLTEIEERRARHAGATASADEQSATVNREHKDESTSIDRDLRDSEEELVRLREKLAPLEKNAAAIRRRTVEVRATQQRLEAKIRATDAKHVTVQGQREDPAALAAELAALKADRSALVADQANLVGELDNVLPQIAALQAEIGDVESRMVRLRASRQESAKRAEELIAAIDSRKVVETRAVADAEAARQLALEELGHRIYVDRPDPMRWALVPIEQIDVELGEKQRQALELRELLSNIEKAPLARGVAYIVGLLAVIGGAVTLYLMSR